MANYGYINRSGKCSYFLLVLRVADLFRSGITTATELLWAQQEMLGLAPDLAAALVGLTAISTLDPTS